METPIQSRVAVASFEGMLVNLHLGEARKLYIFEFSDDRKSYRCADLRPTPPEGGGAARWEELADKVLYDCRALLVGGIGDTPRRILQARGIRIVEMSGLIGPGLDTVYRETPLRTLTRADLTRSGDSCGGNGGGCG
jgi:nitrogen fixation protein NifB